MGVQNVEESTDHPNSPPEALAAPCIFKFFIDSLGTRHIIVYRSVYQN